MRRRLVSSLAVAMLAAAPMAAAETATTTDAVNVRAGPDKAFPTVTWLLSGTRVTVFGCVESWRWCDVEAGRDRGWVYARYLSLSSRGNAVTVLNGGPTLGLPMVAFSVGAYWDDHYRGRPWFGRKAYWDDRWQRRPPAPAWRPPRR